MFDKREKILPLIEKPDQAEKLGGAVDHIAAASAVLVIGLGVAQLVSPLIAAPFTGLDGGSASNVLAVQWIAFGAILALGGLFRMRVMTIFAAEFLLVAGLAGAIVMMLQQPDPLPLTIQGGVALVGLLNSGIARLTDKAELKRELHLLKARAQDLHGSNTLKPKDAPTDV